MISPTGPDKRTQPDDWDAIDQAGWESFPASDPPSYTPGEPRPTPETVVETGPGPAAKRWRKRVLVAGLIGAAAAGIAVLVIQRRRSQGLARFIPDFLR